MAILEALSTYKYLNRAQCARLGIERYNSNYSKYCTPLLRRKFICMIDAKPYGLGFMYYLTKKGADFLANQLDTPMDKIHFVKSEPTRSPRTIFHRTYAIDCQIELALACEEEDVEIDFYDREIETLGSLKKDKQLKRKTRVAINQGQFLEPDGIFRLLTNKGPKLYCFELENETHTKKSFAKIQKHLWALNLKSPSKKYKHEKAHRILMVYKDPRIMESVIAKMQKELSNIGFWFLFKSHEEAVNSFTLSKSTYLGDSSKHYFKNWKTIQGDRTSLY